VAEAVEGLAADVVINIQGDEPLIDPGLIDGLADAMLADETSDMATAAAPIASAEEAANPSAVKVVWRADGSALYFSRSTIPFVRDDGAADAPVCHWRHIGIYAYRKSFLERLVRTPPCFLERAEKLEQLRALHIGGRIRVLQTDEVGIGVDTPEDVKYVERLIQEQGLA
jgi:3-deoxy-manno-octulosonate cytidylyltransferase (CMP-KDO synthetase)